VADPGYDEFGLLRENADEVGLPFPGTPVVERREVEVAPRQRVSAIVWGHGDPELVLLHGGAQNAHTWDTVALALARPLVAIDLPGHGHSDWRADHDYRPRKNAEAVAAVIEQLAPRARAVIGMSLGGLTSIALAVQQPELVRRLLLVDVTPGVNAVKAEPIVSFVSGPESFASFDEILARTIAHNPTRSPSSLRRGVLHNARPREDGRWLWRYDRESPLRNDLAKRGDFDIGVHWDDVERLRMPLLLVRGARSTVVDDADVAELRRRKPDAEVLVVPDAGHSVQGDQPLALARIIERFSA
jgi:pimeloyl-ACP methyl ester carboxylesterase